MKTEHLYCACGHDMSQHRWEGDSLLVEATDCEKCGCKKFVEREDDLDAKAPVDG